MIYYKTDDEIELMRMSCTLLSKTLAHVASLLKPGITGLEVDRAAEVFIRDHDGAVPGFKGLYGFPGTLCISTNAAVVHGIPTNREFEEDDIVSIDCGVLMNEFYGDSAYTFAFNGISDEIEKLLSVTKKALYLGIDQARVGNRVGDIGYSIQDFAEKQHGFGVVRDLVGHGLGKDLHEAPEVPNYGKRGRGVQLKDGLVIAIEPMINLGNKAVKKAPDGTILSKDNMPSAHYEHTIAVRTDGPDILSNHEWVEEEIKKNSEIRQIQ